MTTTKDRQWVAEVTVLLILALVGFGCSASAPPRPADGRPCMTNFSAEGSFWTSRTFKSHQEFPNGDRATAFDRVLAAVASEGWQIVSSNKDAGLISASQSVSYGQGAAVPLNIVLKPGSPTGYRVDLVFITTGGVAVSLESVQDQFCKILAAAGI